MSDVETPAAPAGGGKLIVLTAPLTETIDHAGYFIQMSMASLPMWLEGILNRKYPQWRNVEYNADGTAKYMPAGVRVLEASLLRRFTADDIVCCYPDAEALVGDEVLLDVRVEEAATGHGANPARPCYVASEVKN